MRRRRRGFILAGAGGGAAVQPFSFQSETETLATSFAVAPTDARKRTIDRAFRRLKASTVWAKARWLQFIGEASDASRINWKNPAEIAAIVGAPVFTANQHWAGASGANHLVLPFNANELAQNNHAFCAWTQTGHMAGTATTSGSVLGAINAGAQGISLVVNNAGQINGRSASSTIGTLGAVDGFGLVGLSRNNSANFQSLRNGSSPVTSVTASVALPALPISLLGVNNNGTTSGNAIATASYFYLGEALTEAEHLELTGIVGEYLEHIRYGEPIVEEVGIGTAVITKDFIVYGMTGQGLCAAYQAARAGLQVAIAAGWRDFATFGMAGGALGFTDYDSIVMGGLGRWLITQCNTFAGISDDHVTNGIGVFKFQSKHFNRACLSLLNPATNGGFNIPIYLTGGVDSVDKTGTVINSFHTVDGRTFNAQQFFDGSYEMDLYRIAGLSYIKGREAEGTGAEANNGVEQIADTAPPLDGAGATIIVDPWVTPGVPASGALSGIHSVYSTFEPGIHTYPVEGSADSRIPAYNFRLTMTTTFAHRHTLPTTPPPGFDAANYEILLRQIAAAALTTPLTIATLFKPDNLRTSNRYDINNNNVFSTNFIGENWNYPEASYAERELIWKSVWNHILGLWYVLQHHDDARINGTALRTEALTWGFCSDHYYSPHGNDQVFHMPQMYVRESIRAISDVVMNGNHMQQTDGQVPTLGDHTVTTASYDMDSHSMQRVAYESSAGVYTIRAEGGMLITSGGANALSPLPFEIFVPKVTECTNLSFAFGCSTTHMAYGTTRMEFTAMQTGQSMGHAAALAIANDNVIQNVTYATLRAGILGSPTLSGEVAATLQQVT